MLRIITVTILAAAMLASPAQAQSITTNLLRDFGFTGSWAPDCNAPPGPGNSLRTITVDPQGFTRFKEELGKDFMPNEYLVLSARRIDPNRIEIRVEFAKRAMQDLTMVREGNDRLRTFGNVNLDGTIIVQDGLVLPANGRPTPWMNRCR